MVIPNFLKLLTGALFSNGNSNTINRGFARIGRSGEYADYTKCSGSDQS
jgi:hypothetical protein